MQNLVEKTYRTFLTRVANGRNMTTAEVDSIGQGRVWSGLNAKEIGLVDKFGGLNDAIKIAAKRARIKKYKVVEYPKKKEFMEQLMDALKEDFEQTYIKSLVPGEWKEQAGLLEYIKNHKGVMAIMPYIITFN